MMRNRPIEGLLRLLPLAALGVALAGGGGVAKATIPAAAVDAPFLWQVEGTQKPSYLFGTIHAGVQSAELPVAVDMAIAQSDVFVMETAPPRGFAASAKGEVPMDLMLANRAERWRKPIALLETMEFQLNLLRQLGSTEDVAAMLASDSGEIEPLVQAYRSGDLRQIESIVCSGDFKERELLLTQRNHRWMHQLRRMLTRGGAFVAVGVGHFPGEQGLLDLMNRTGRTVTRIV